MNISLSAHGERAPANDNSPRHTDHFTDLSERRAWLACLPQESKAVLAWPTLERLSRADPEAAKALSRYAALAKPSQAILQADVGDASTDATKEIRPSVDELLRQASNGLRTFVVSEKEAGDWKFTYRHAAREPDIDGDDVRLGNLSFRSGRLVSFGQTKKGRQLQPREIARSPKGSKTSPRSASSIRYLLPANDNAPVAKGAGWLGGITRPRGNTSKPDLGEHEAAIEMDRRARFDAVRRALGLHANVLDAAISDATAKQIGEAFGYEGKTAERQGLRKIQQAIEKFRQIAA